MPVPKEVLDLVERFGQHLDDYRNGRYTETQVRRDYIDPLFKALGWDVDNSQGLAEAYRDVIHEDTVKVGGNTKAPDYSFRIGGTRKFFVEAKKPSVYIKGEPEPAFQVRRYAWSGKLPLSILTDFEEFAVYDCRIKPAKTDKAAFARIHYWTFREYAEKWDEIAAVFSKDAVLKGSFDKYAVAVRGKKGTAEVDAAFLGEIESWRELLARNIALRNEELSQRALNYAVQQTIDRIIFLRICEDRGIEPYGQLQALQNGADIYKRLTELFHKADERYNSGLFHFRKEQDRAEEPDRLTLGLAIDDKPLKEIFQHLYYPDSPYEFSVLGADILGSVYEQFLGKVIRLTEGHHAKIEEKPEVKKAGGVYYTPTYIVGYIVKHTVGKLLEGKTPKQVESRRILDPACGSGSFLIGAYQYLLDWHRDWYEKDGAEKHAKGKQPELYQGKGGVWRLTTNERKRILTNNIYGVDIDSQAVEVTKLSLLLKVLEGESDQTLQTQLFHERVLPDLGRNIKCGNSLIGPDFYEQQSLSLDDIERARINVFDWLKEFSEIMKSGGFDAVIGNPPYIRMEGFKELKDYLKAHYSSHDERSDLYAYFIEKGHGLLTERGCFGMIVSNKFLRANYGKPLREFLSTNASIEHVVDFAGLPVFAGATVRTIVLLTARNPDRQGTMLYSPPLPVEKFAAVSGGSLTVEQAIASETHEVAPGALKQAVWSFGEAGADELLARLKAHCIPLAKYCDGQICRGVVSGLTEAFVIDAETRADILQRNPKAAEIIKPFLNGRDVRRYQINYNDQYLIYAYHGVDIGKYPAVEAHLKPFRDKLLKRATKQEWYELQQPQYKFAKFMDEPKIIFPDIATAPRFALDETGYYSSNTTYFIPRRDLYLLGLLNSNLGRFYFIKTCAGLEGKNETYLRFFGQYLEGFPIRTLNLDDPGDRARRDKMISLVESMIALNKQLAAAKTPHEQENLKRQIDATDRQIDKLVYELYGLSEEEIKVVEGAQ